MLSFYVLDVNFIVYTFTCRDLRASVSLSHMRHYVRIKSERDGKNDA